MLNLYYVRFLESAEAAPLVFPHPSEDSDYLSACHLRDLGLLDQSTVICNGKHCILFSLSVVGVEALEKVRNRQSETALRQLFQNIGDEETENKREKRISKNLQYLNAISPFIIFLLGLLVGNKTDLLSRLASFFQK